ncbi:heavy metal translocating P-type ATPase [Aeoliella mucimassa]|uniref:Copper-exporting P-type ATPase A n=1 Tax=Aeoliella mucimassa TaxID=2527972 RepID=A0A518ALZ3_9BACT|nr:heavy metal translocating P-type ATPase [Aeoliella mucimassa]QDU55752.1 Copper-exporting P-type ATPase A [Aeoliella mucimassa]
MTAVPEVVCDHCGLPVPRGLVDPDAELQFCCNGCRTVYGMLHEHGLDEFYHVRSVVDAPKQAVRSTTQKYEAYDDPAFLAKNGRPLAGGYLSIDLRLEGVHCAACMWLVERLPKLIAGLASAKLQMRDAVVRLTWDPAETKLSTIATALDRLGYPAHPARDTTASDIHRRSEHAQLIRLGVAGACAGNTMLLAIALYAGQFAGIEDEFKNLFRYVSALIGALALVWPGSVFFRGAISSLRARSATLDVPIALALAAGGLAGVVNAIRGTGEIYFDSLSVLVFLLLVGRWFQARQQRWADEAVGLLNSFTPSTCRVVREDLVIEITTDSLVTGDIVEVLSGGVLPADGVLVEGQSSLNRSLLTGESRPEPVVVGDDVFAGTQNIGSPIRLRVESIGEATRVGQLMDMVAEGVREKPPIIQFTDRAAGWFVTIVVSVATLTFIVWAATATLAEAVEHTIALLIVACPCALGLATPLTLAVAIGLAAKRHILIKNAGVFEILAGGGRMLLDKTGTVTRGRPTLIEWSGAEWLAPIVAHAESHSTHPIATAFVEAFGSQPIEDRQLVPRDIEEQHGGGLRGMTGGDRLLVGSPRFLAAEGVTIDAAQADRIASQEQAGRTMIGVAVAGELLATAALGDRLHDDSVEAFQQLESLGWHPSILSGDATGVVASVAEQLSIPSDKALGGVTPEQKLALVTAERSEPTVMIGDGVNDSAALAAADVGIAVEGGAEASLAAADVYIAAPGLSPVVDLVRLARRTRRTVRQNLVLALAYNTLAVSLAAAGWITPLVAAILMPISSATVLASAMSITLGGER